MPEGIEVEITRRKLEASLARQRLRSIDILDKRLARSAPVSMPFNIRLNNITRHGKVLLFNLENGKNFSLSLGMSGSILCQDVNVASNNTKPRLVMNFENKKCSFFDVRRLGRFFYPGKIPIGWDILSHTTELAAPKSFESVLSASVSPVKTLLMDQNKIAGIGNIYANEILFEAQIRPLRRASSLSSKQKQYLWQAARKILNQALELGGSSIKDFVHPDGQKGSFQRAFKVYAKKKSEPCPRCAKPLKVIQLNQRATIYCVCQK